MRKKKCSQKFKKKAKSKKEKGWVSQASSIKFDQQIS